jgi:hypothetical protein
VITAKYIARLENYLEWEKSFPPVSSFQASKANPPFFECGGSVSAAEWIWNYETHGKTLSSCGEPELLLRYWWGKANRDWWTKEIGWWNRNASSFRKNSWHQYAHFRSLSCLVERP